VGVSRNGPNGLEYPLLSQERVKLRISNLAGIFTGCMRTKAGYNLGENGAWAYLGTVQFFFEHPLLSQERVKLYTKFKFGRYIHRVHRTKKFFWEMERGRIQQLPKFFQYLLLSQERVKLQISNFVRTFLISIETKAHYKFREK